MLSKVLTTSLLVGFMLVLVGCGPSLSAALEQPLTPTTAASAQSTATLTVLKITGSSTVLQIVQAVQPAFEADVPGHRLTILDVDAASSSSSAALEGIQKGVLDLAVLTRAPKDKERAAGVDYLEFGHAGVAALTHRDVGVQSLTSAQMVGIFSGEITDWSAVGGPDLPILLYTREEDSSSTEALRKTVLGDTPFPASSQTLDGSAALRYSVAGAPGAIGYAIWPRVVIDGDDVQPLALDGVAPTEPAYPITIPLVISFMDSHRSTTQPLIDWLRSPAGQAALREIGVIITE